MKIPKLFMLSLAAGTAWGIPTKNSPEEVFWQEKRESQQSQGGKTFSLNEARNENFKNRDVPAELVRARLKYNLTAPSNFRLTGKPGPKKNGNHHGAKVPRDGFAINVPTPLFDSEYILPVEIGNPPQMLPLVLDTGSSDLWTFSTDTQRSWISGHVLYQPLISLTSRLLNGYTWRVKYGDESEAYGIVYEDTVRIGGTRVDRQAVQTAVKAAKPFHVNTFTSGILGMAANGANSVQPVRQKTYLYNVRDQLSQPLFTADLQKGRAGTYDFGFINNAKYTGQIKYENIDRFSPFWMVTASGYQVGKAKFIPRQWDAIVDTGSTLLMLPDDMVLDYYQDVQSAVYDADRGVVVFSCKEKLPDFVFGLGQDFRGVVPGHYMNYYTDDGEHCYGGIQPANGAPFAIMGDILLKAQFVVFDIGKLRVGFANKPTDPPPWQVKWKQNKRVDEAQ